MNKFSQLNFGLLGKGPLDQRLGFVGASGSGKTYGAGVLIERLLASQSRACIVDPLGVWYGLRLKSDGKSASKFEVPIFGGPRGDVPITEHSGALIGETVAGMRESCIIDLSELGMKAAERRFMLAFTAALYRKHSGSPLHIVIDEADMFAPQNIRDKDGDAAKLLGMMETLVRRGRVKGFIPWLISQRPAVLNKDVLSQVDGLAAFKLPSPQDRDALGSWVEGAADREVWKEVRQMLPTFAPGHALLWLPAQNIMQLTAFPLKSTFDSSRTPKRGEKAHAAALTPLDVGKLKEALASLVEEAKANDPRALRARIAELERAAKAGKPGSASNQAEKIDMVLIKAAEKRGWDLGYAKGTADAYSGLRKSASQAARKALDAASEVEALSRRIDAGSAPAPAPPSPSPVPAPRPRFEPAASGSPGSALPEPLQKIVNALHWWGSFGKETPSQPMVAFIAGYSHKSGTWRTYLSKLRSEGLIESGGGTLRLTSAGLAYATMPVRENTREAFHDAVLEQLQEPHQKILIPLLEAYPHASTPEEVASRAGYSSTSGTWRTYLSRLRSLELINRGGDLKAQDWLFP